MKFKKGTFTLSLLTYGIGLILYYVIGQTYLHTALNAILGWAGAFGDFLAAAIVFLIIPVFQAVMLHFWRSREKNEYQAYVKAHTEKSYTMKEYFLEAWRDPYMHGEGLMFAIFTGIYTVFLLIYNFIYVTVVFDASIYYTWRALYTVLHIPIFLISVTTAYAIMHKNWIEYHNEL